MPKFGKKNKYHYSSLWYAVKFNNVQMVEMLLDTGAKANEECGKDHGSVLHLAAKNDFTEIVKLLLENGADLKKRDRFGNTPLHSGASQERVALELLKHNADVNAKNAFGETPLHYAGSALVVHRMIAREVDLDAQDRHGETALVRAFERRRNGVLLALFLAGAKTNLPNKFGKMLTVDDVKLKQYGITSPVAWSFVYINGRQNCMHFGERTFPALVNKIESGQFRVVTPSYCDILKAAKINDKPILTSIDNTKYTLKGEVACGQLSNANVRVKRNDKSERNGARGGKQNRAEKTTKYTQAHFKGEVACGQLSNTNVRVKQNDKSKRNCARGSKQNKTGNMNKYKQAHFKGEVACGQLSNDNVRVKQNDKSEGNCARRSKQNKAEKRTIKLKYAVKTCNAAEEENAEALSRAREDRTEDWNRAQDKKKSKRREETAVDMRVRRKRKTRLNSIGGYRNISVMIRSQEKDYYDICYIADRDARNEWSNAVIWAYYNK